MPWTGSAPNQTTQRTDGVRTGAAVCTQARDALVNDTAPLCDAREQDLADMIALCLKKDGGNQAIANIPMNTYKFTGVGAATARDDFARASQAQDSSLIYGGTAGGSANAITLDLTPNITAYAAGQMFLFKAASDNTGAVDVNIDGVGSVNLFKFDGATELVDGDIQAGGIYLIGCNGTDFVLLGGLPANVSALAALSGSSGKVPMFTGAGAFSLVDRTDLGVPSGTAMLFQQTAAPTGWTKDTTHNNKALRIVSGAAGTGGSAAFTTAFASRTIAASNLPVSSPWALSDPGHTHSYTEPINANSPTGSGATRIEATQAGTTGSNTTGISLGSNSGGGQAMDFAVAYVDVIIATKNA